MIYFYQFIGILHKYIFYDISLLYLLYYIKTDLYLRFILDRKHAHLLKLCNFIFFNYFEYLYAKFMVVPNFIFINFEDFDLFFVIFVS